MISKGTGYYALRYSLSGLVIQLVCSGYTVCLGRKHNQAGAVVQPGWGNMHRQNGMWEFGIIIFFDFLHTIYSPILCFIYVCTVCLHQLFCHFHHICHTYTFLVHYKIKNNTTRFSIFYFVFNWQRYDKNN